MLMAYDLSKNPDCSDPAVRASLPDALCNYPAEVIAQICARQPSLCRPYGAAEPPSIWEPVWGTVTEAVKPFGQVVTGAGQATLGVGQFVLALPQMLTLGLLVYGLYLVTQSER